MSVSLVLEVQDETQYDRGCTCDCCQVTLEMADSTGWSWELEFCFLSLLLPANPTFRC